jgi:hypothetical protein
MIMVLISIVKNVMHNVLNVQNQDLVQDVILDF